VDFYHDLIYSDC